MGRSALLLLTLLLAAGPAPARDCIAGSIGPGGCGSIRPGDLPPELPGQRPLPDLSLPTDVPLGVSRGERDELLELRALRRVRPRGDSVLPPVTEPPMGRDPQALQRFQAPYRLD